MIKPLCLLLVLCTSPCSPVELRSVRTNMYLTSSFEFCMRYLTSNGVTGCSSQRSGNRGRLVDVSSLSDLTHQPFSQPTIVLIPPRKDLLEFAIHSAPMVKGILIDGHGENSTTNGFTEVGVCPDDEVGSSNCSIRRNQQGIDFRAMRIDKPIFLVTNRTAIAMLRQFYHQYNHAQMSGGRYVGVRMTSFAYGVQNAQVCSRRSKANYFSEAYFKHYSIKCRSPMINIVWGTLNAVAVKTGRPTKSVIVLYTKLDFFSVFQPKNAGAQSTGFGVVTLLALAWMLGRTKLSQMLVATGSDKDIVLLFLNGENWDHYGAMELTAMIRDERFPYAITKTTGEDHLHPIKAEHIDLIVNIDQLGIDDGNAYILYDHTHPFLDRLQNTSTSILSKQIPSTLRSLRDFHSLNVSSLAIFTDAYEDMNPLYNSRQDTLHHVKTFTTVEKHVYALLEAICGHFNLSQCTDMLPPETNQTLVNRIAALFDCFLRSNCTDLVAHTNETGAFYFSEVSDGMRQPFSFLQPSLHSSEVKSYLNAHFLDASSYIHDVLLNWLAVRTPATTQTACHEREEASWRRIYQESTQTCLRVSVNSINLIHDTDASIDDRLIFTSNYDKPELLVYMTGDTSKDVLMLVCGALLVACGSLQSYFLKHLLPMLLAQNDELQ